MKEYEMNARASGTIKERELYDLWVVADCLMSFCEFKDRILAAIQPDTEPQPVVFGRQHFEPKRDSDRQPWDATPSSAGMPTALRYVPTITTDGATTPSSAGTVSVEAAAKVLLGSMIAEHERPGDNARWHNVWREMERAQGYAWNRMEAALRALAGDQP